MANYFLHVDLIVRAADESKFEGKVAEFMARGGFGHLGPELRSEFVLALKTKNPFNYTGYEGYEAPEGAFEKRDRRIEQTGEKTGYLSALRYVHLWRIPSPDLVPAMSRSADDKLYTALDAFVVREIQNLVVPVPRFGATRPPKGTRFIRATRKFASKDLGSYLFKSGALVSALEAKEWYLLGQYQNVTGPLNTVTEFWQVPSDHTHTAAAITSALGDLGPNLTKSLLGGQAGLEALLQAEVRESFVQPGYFV
jgi:hypothetical protein